MKKRNEIEEKYTWDLSKLCSGKEEFYKNTKQINEFLPKIKAFEGKLNNKESILQYLKLEEEFTNFVEPVALYCQLKSVEVLSDSERQEMKQVLSSVLNNVSIETSFVASELNKLSNSQLDDIINDKRFKDYDRVFENIKKNKKHMLSKAEEKLLSGMNFLSGFSSNMDMLSDVDMKFGSIKDSKGKLYELNHSSYSSLVRSGDRKLRKLAFEKMNGAYGKYINTFANNYISEVKANSYFAKVRKYKNALERELDNDEVDKKVYTTLLKQVERNLDLLFDYFSVKGTALGLKSLYIYDTLADVGKISEKKYTFDEAIALIKRAVSPLGEEYVSLVQQAKDQRWIDVYPNEDKSSGAFETGIYNYHPFVMTNFDGSLDDVFTLAHELGHAMHTYFSNKAQPQPKADYPIFLAEIASTANEMLLINYLLSSAKDKQNKIALYNKLFDQVKGTIFRQTMFSEFEEKVHKIYDSGEALTKDVLCGIYFVLNRKYFGSVKLIDQIKYEWARIPHFFNAFYVFKYATGLISAITFTNKILSQEQDAVDNYLNFLSSGSSKNPVQILKECGCDLTDEKTFDSCFSYLKNMLQEWKNLDK